MQKHLESFTNVNEQFTSQMSLRTVESKFEEYNNMHLSSALKQERMKNLELGKELDDWKAKCSEFEEIHLQKQKQDTFETMIVSIENYIQEHLTEISLTGSKRLNWENEAGMLLSDYQDDLKELQDKYIQQL